MYVSKIRKLRRQHSKKKLIPIDKKYPGVFAIKNLPLPSNTKKNIPTHKLTQNQLDTFSQNPFNK